VHIKKFVKLEPDSYLNRYEGLEVKYIPGHNPDLVIYEDEVEKERIDLTKIAAGKNTPEIADIEALLTEKGFAMKPAPPPDSCADKVADCQGWATAGECQSNPGYMNEMCPKACGTCQTQAANKDEM